jgi:hypothetical protein
MIGAFSLEKSKKKATREKALSAIGKENRWYK